MNRFTTVTSRVVQMLVNDIDTDQIIPARFLKVTDKSGLGDHLFADWRYGANGSTIPDFPLNKAESRGAQILLSGDNFGCGSSREHALWALTGFGFRSVISTSFADIFSNNAVKNGLLPVAVQPEDHRRLVRVLSAAPDTLLTIDLAAQTVKYPGGEAIQFPIEEFSKFCLLSGVDELEYLQGFQDRITEYEEAHRR